MKLAVYSIFVFTISIQPLMAQTPAQDSLFLNKVQALKDVEVLGKAPVLRIGADKKVFAVDQSLISSGGSAIDVLKNIPSLQIDGNGNISLRGASNIKVFVDGKESLIGGGSIKEILEIIPVSTIEKIEVVTNPSVKSDASGQAIINIVLKKTSKRNDNGSLTTSIDTRENLNVEANITHRFGKANIFANYTFQRKNTYSNGFQNMTYLNSNDPTYFSNEIFPSTTIRNIHFAQAGVDYHLSSKDLLTITGLYNASTFNRHEYLTIDNLTKQQTPTQLSNRTNTSDGANNNDQASLDFSHQFKKAGEKLDFDFTWSQGATNSYQVYKTNITNLYGQSVFLKDNILQDTKNGKSNNYNIQLDYTLPINKNIRLELGARSQFSQSNNHQWDSNLDTLTGLYNADYSLINFFKTQDQIHAVYINYRQQFKNLVIQVGLRGELSRFNASLQNYDSTNELISTPINVNTNGLYPALSLIQQFAHSQQVQLTYARRINRPKSSDINPFPDVSDPVNYDEGNPSLRPEDIHSIELTYKKTWSRASFTSGFYYTLVNNVIKHIQENPVNDITITIPENLKRAINTGFELISNIQPLSIWSFTANINIFERINSAAPQFGIEATHGFSWNGNINNDFSLAKNLTVQLRADYKSSEQILQDSYRAAYGFDLGAKYVFAHNRADLSFSARDIFNTRRPAFLRVSDSLLLDWQRITYSSRASISCNWHFGRTP